MARGLDSRLVALVALGALALHHLRYLLAHGEGAGAALEREGHAYLELALGPLLALVLAALAASVVRRALAPAPSGGRRSGRATFACLAAATLATYAAQELVEGLIFAGHPAGAAALLANGGWLALPLALAVGAVLLVLARFLERAEDALGELVRARPRLGRAPRSLGAPLARRLRPAPGPLAFALRRRPPPRCASSG